LAVNNTDHPQQRHTIMKGEGNGKGEEKKEREGEGRGKGRGIAPWSFAGETPLFGEYICLRKAWEEVTYLFKNRISFGKAVSFSGGTV